MKGNIKVRDLEELRENGYRFLRNKARDKLNVFYNKELLYSIRVKQNGHLIVTDRRKEGFLERKKGFTCEGIEFFLNPLDDGLSFLIAT